MKKNSMAKNHANRHFNNLVNLNCQGCKAEVPPELWERWQKEYQESRKGPYYTWKPNRVSR